MDLKGTTALVRGAAFGLGAATTQARLADGVTVVDIDLPSSIEQVPIQDGLTFIAADVTKEDEVRAALDAVGGRGTAPRRQLRRDRASPRNRGHADARYGLGNLQGGPG